jgi:hypothetical protein
MAGATALGGCREYTPLIHTQKWCLGVRLTIPFPLPFPMHSFAVHIELPSLRRVFLWYHFEVGWPAAC